jgi:hypothetical protein
MAYYAAAGRSRARSHAATSASVIARVTSASICGPHAPLPLSMKSPFQGDAIQPGKIAYCIHRGQ